MLVLFPESALSATASMKMLVIVLLLHIGSKMSPEEQNMLLQARPPATLFIFEPQSLDSVGT